jgi:hypothetical protein
MKKRLFAAILALTMILCLSIPALAVSPEVRKAEYEGRGYVEVDFKTRVQYKNVSVTVKDPAGNALTAKITDKDDDDITFYVKGLKPGVKYDFTISGVRKGQSGSYGKVSGTFKTPKSELSVKEAEYDRREGELELEFCGRVQYNNPKVVIKDAAGKTYTCRICELDRDEMEIAVKGLESGKYTVKITGIRLYGEKTYTSITATFRVR